MLVTMDRRGAGERGPPREYDLLGNLPGVALPDGRTVEYDVDGAGRRVGRRMLSSTGVELEYRGWIYRDLLRPIAEVDALGNVVARYVYADGEGAKQNGVSQLSTRLGANQDTSLPFVGENVPELIELLSGSVVTQRLRLIKDQVGTVELVADASTGEALQRIEHDEFGRVLFDSDPGLQPLGFAGGLYDAETGLVRFGARDYDPAIGRWTARDPVREKGGLNAFAYSECDPTNSADPSGYYGGCSYYSARCEQNGGSYYCQTAPYYCNWFKDFPAKDWAECTRECLQSCDASSKGIKPKSPHYDDESGTCEGTGETPDNSHPLKSWKDTDNWFGNWDCHFDCYTDCSGF